MFEITNYKISLKCKIIFLDNVENILQQKSIKYKKFNNFLSFFENHFFIIFKNKINTKLNHINVTKIKSEIEIDNVIKYVEKTFNTIVVYNKVDNIIATCKSEIPLNLRLLTFKLKYPYKFNNEKFPGLFIKFCKGTSIVFHSGKIVILGCQTKQDIEWIIQKLSVFIKIK